MKVINIGNIADAFRFDDLPATGIVIEAAPEELERLPNLAYKEVTISATPRRNCDVGTDNDQIGRWKEFCDLHEVDRSPESFARWAQGPYFEEGGDK